MAGSMLASSDWRAPNAATPVPRVRALVQRGFLSPDQAGGQRPMWANVVALWALRCSEPPRAVSSAGIERVGLWLACDCHDGVHEGQRVLLDEAVWRIDQVCRDGPGGREMWLRLVHDDRAG
ncbi:MAG: hypothetical protein RIM84_21690 [Alphaproteobacteria bacterium]